MIYYIYMIIKTYKFNGDIWQRPFSLNFNTENIRAISTEENVYIFGGDIRAVDVFNWESKGLYQGQPFNTSQSMVGATYFVWYGF